MWLIINGRYGIIGDRRFYYAKNKPVSNTLDIGGRQGAIAASNKIYVTILSSAKSQNDTACLRGINER
jgi:hypothetical protein